MSLDLFLKRLVHMLMAYIIPSINNIKKLFILTVWIMCSVLILGCEDTSDNTLNSQQYSSISDIFLALNETEENVVEEISLQDSSVFIIINHDIGYIRFVHIRNDTDAYELSTYSEKISISGSEPLIGSFDVDDKQMINFLVDSSGTIAGSEQYDNFTLSEDLVLRYSVES